MDISLSGSNTYVYADWVGMETPETMGILKVTRGRNEILFSFSYKESWLKRKDSFYLDPNLQLFTGPQYPAASKSNFGIFLDSYAG